MNSTEWNIIFIIAGVIALSIILKIISFFIHARKLPYAKKSYLLTRSELAFFRILEQAVKEIDVYIFSKVRIADILYVKKGTKNWQSYFNKISCKHIDFLICDKKNVSPLIGIELDDSSHNRQDRIERDKFVNSAYSSAGLPLLHIPVAKSYNANEIKNLIKKMI